MSISSRAKKVLAAILLLPEGQDGWRRATYRDQLHESVGLSRGAVARAFRAGELAGLVDVEGVVASARRAQGYRLTAEGERLATEAGSAPTRSSPDPAPIQPPDPVFGFGLSLENSRTKREQEPTITPTDPAPIQLADPAPPHARLDMATVVSAVLAKGLERLNVVISLSEADRALLRDLATRPAYPIATSSPATSLDGPPSCDCGPMVKRSGERGEFYGCSTWTSSGGGCGAKTVSAGQAMHRTSPSQSDEDRRARDAARAAAAADRAALLEADEARGRMSAKARAEAMRAQMQASASGRAAPDRLSVTVHGDALRLLGRG